MRLLLAALLGFALAVVPALAAEHTVTARNFEFGPDTITVAPGDTVTFTQSEGDHTVHFAGEPSGTSLAAPVRRTFPTPGTFEFFCDPHAPDMKGRVVVKAEDTTGTTPITQTATTTPTTSTPTTTTPTSTPVVKPAVTVRIVGATFRSRTGVRLRVSSDRARTLTGTFRRANRTVGSLRLRVTKGSRIYRVRRTRAGRRLAPGSYRLTLRSSGAYGLPVTVKFRVR